jgi:hypothetical protein
MRNHQPRTQLFASPETLFTSCGEDMSPIYPQPGITPAEQWSHCSPYDKGAAGIESIQKAGLKLADTTMIIGLRKVAEARISNAISNADSMVADRQRVAEAYNEGLLSLLIYSGKYDKIFGL